MDANPERKTADCPVKDKHQVGPSRCHSAHSLITMAAVVVRQGACQALPWEDSRGVIDISVTAV